jgi:hypothetical protein
MTPADNNAVNPAMPWGLDEASGGVEMFPQLDPAEIPLSHIEVDSSDQLVCPMDGMGNSEWSTSDMKVEKDGESSSEAGYKCGPSTPKDSTVTGSAESWDLV